MSVKKKLLLYATMFLMTFTIMSAIVGLYIRSHPYNPKYNYLGKLLYPADGIAGANHYTFDPITGYSLIPNIIDPLRKISTDKNGFRNTGKTINPDLQSVIFVGDSTVFGWGVKDSASFPYLIASSPLLKDYNVINMGVPSYSLGHIVNVLKYKVPKLKAKLVFVAILWPWKPFEAYSSENAWKEIDFDFYKKTIPLRTKFTPSQKNRGLYSTVGVMFRDVYYRIKFKERIRDNLTRPGVRDFTISEGQELALAREHVQALKAAAQPLTSSGIKVIFYIHPYQYTVFNEKYQNLGKTGRDLMIRDLPAYYPGDYLKKEFSDQPLFIDGSHLTEAGHRVYSKLFLEKTMDYLGQQSNQ